MLHTVTVCAAENPYTRAAQEHAIEIAGRFGARLRVVSVARPAEGEAPAEENPQEVVEREADVAFRAFEERAARADVNVERDARYEGAVEGLLAGAAESDLLVLGMPSEAQAREDDLAEAMLDREMRVLRKSECPVMVVHDPPEPVETILVDYHGGVEGKAALRIAGELGTRMQAKAAVNTAEGDLARAARMAAIAEAYFGGFPDLKVETLEHRGVPESESDILSTAEKAGADFIVVGGEPTGFFDRLLGRDTPEELARQGRLPVVIAR